MQGKKNIYSIYLHAVYPPSDAEHTRSVITQGPESALPQSNLDISVPAEHPLPAQTRSLLSGMYLWKKLCEWSYSAEKIMTELYDSLTTNHET